MSSVNPPITIEIFAKKLANLTDAQMEILKKVIDAEMKVVINKARRMTPIPTNNLKNSVWNKGKAKEITNRIECIRCGWRTTKTYREDSSTAQMMVFWCQGKCHAPVQFKIVKGFVFR